MNIRKVEPRRIRNENGWELDGASAGRDFCHTHHEISRTEKKIKKTLISWKYGSMEAVKEKLKRLLYRIEIAEKTDMVKLRPIVRENALRVNSRRTNIL